MITGMEATLASLRSAATSSKPLMCASVSVPSTHGVAADHEVWYSERDGRHHVAARNKAGRLDQPATTT